MNTKNVSLLLRAALAFAFLYPAIDSLLFHPETWYSFFPKEILSLLPFGIVIATKLFAVFEIIVAAGILFLPRPVMPAVIAALTLFAITGLNLSSWDIVFRDVSLALAALALARLHLTE